MEFLNAIQSPMAAPLKFRATQPPKKPQVTEYSIRALAFSNYAFD